MASIFAWLCAAVGGVFLSAGVLALGAYGVVQVMKYLRVWHVICLAVSVRLHGKDFADTQFWWAIAERASKGHTSARIIADYAMENAPKDTQP